jgi:hypothetical protein
MNIEAFNRMLRSARDLLAKYHEGVTFDPATVQWAQELVAANPTDKRRSSPLRDAVLALFDVDPLRKSTGMTSGEMAGLVGLTTKDLAANLYHMVHGACPILWAHQPRGARWAQHFDTAAARDAFAAQAAQAEQAEEQRRQERRLAAEARSKEIKELRAARAQRRAEREQRRAEAAAAPAPPPKIPRLAKTTRPREHVKKPEPIELSPARKAFNGAVSTFKERSTLTTPKTANARVNPDQGGAWAPKPKAEVQATIPEGLQVQRGEAYTHDPRYQCAPNERPAGAGFAAEWARLRGAQA